MAQLIRSPRAKRDIVEVLEFTKERWGRAHALEYGELIRQALRAIADDPKRGKSRDDVLSGALAYHIKQRGRPARHIIFYRIGSAGAVEVVRVLHDAMDFEQHLR
ncbi:MAG: type II toxin-antitoxin system RelE/ParE family toxin [Polyangiaceae bacterium]